MDWKEQPTSLEHFRISFDQKVDYKGQPQSEVKGGRIHIDLAQSVALLFTNGPKAVPP